MNPAFDELIQKYLEGETSKEEEVLIRIYFSSEKVQPNHEFLRPYFEYMESLGQSTIEVNALDIVNRAETASKRVRTLSIRRAITLAAAVVTLLMISYMLSDNWTNDDERITNTNSKELREDAEFALLLLSSKLNEGSNFFTLKNNENDQ